MRSRRLHNDNLSITLGQNCFAYRRALHWNEMPIKHLKNLTMQLENSKKAMEKLTAKNRLFKKQPMYRGKDITCVLQRM